MDTLTTSASEIVAQQLRRHIVEGRWPPGSRLPARADLARELDSCLATLQDAVASMVDEGFLEVASRKLGTYVTEHPPHLSRYRLIFPFGPDDWGQFWTALQTAASDRSRQGRQFLCFYGLSGHRDISEYREVVREVQTRQVAGLILASSARELRGTPLLDAPELPRVAIAGKGELPGVPKVQADLASFMERAVGQLQAHGRRRIAILCSSHATMMLQHFRTAMAAHGLPTDPSFEQFASQRNPAAAKHLMRLLFRLPAAERPDGLIIASDDLLASATAGIAQACAPAPERLSVVALTNFPHRIPAAIPVIRIGFHIPTLLDQLVARLEQLRRGESPPEHTDLPAVTDSSEVPFAAS